jgi:WD40 repeat protein
VVVWVDNKNSTRETVYAKLDGHYDDITSVAFCHQSILATGSYDGKIILWKISSDSTPKGELVPPDDHLKTSEQKPIEQLQFLPNRGKTLAALSMDAKVYVWRIVDGMHMYTLHTEHKVSLCAWTPRSTCGASSTECTCTPYTRSTR